MEEDKEKNSGNNDGIVIKKKHIVIVAIIVLLLLIGGVFAGMNWNNWFGEKKNDKQSSQSSQSQTSVDIDPNAGDYTGEKPQDKGGASQGIKIPGYPSITIAKDTKNVQMALMNPEGNPCYFMFEIVLKDGNETLYKSNYVEPGKAIYDVTLQKPLAEGEHPAVIKITTLSLDGKNPLNGANVETVLIAK